MSSPNLDVRDVARLARIELTDEEVATFQSQLGKVLEYVEQLKSLESQTYDVVSKTLETAISKAEEDGVDLTDEKQLNALVDSAAPTMRETLKKAIDELYAEYTEGADSVGSSIEELTAPDKEKQLTPLQQSQREILLTGLAIIQRMESDPSRAPLQGVLDIAP